MSDMPEPYRYDATRCARDDRSTAVTCPVVASDMDVVVMNPIPVTPELHTWPLAPYCNTCLQELERWTVTEVHVNTKQ